MDKISIILFSILIFTLTLQVSASTTKIEPEKEASHKPANVDQSAAATVAHSNETSEATPTETKNSTVSISTTAVPGHSKAHDTTKKPHSKGKSSAISTATHLSPIVIFLLGFTGIISSTIGVL